jgi:CheY-like chemotaxis protein
VTSGEVVSGLGEDHAPVILLVEDEVLVRFATAELLRDEGYVVLEAVNASEALALIATGHPLDLVLSDIRMPGLMDGVDLTFAVKQARQNLPVALVSSHLDPDREHAADAFLAKPYRPEQLVALVEQLAGAEWQTRFISPIAS